LERLLLEAYAGSIFAQLARRQIDFENAESQELGLAVRRRDGHGDANVVYTAAASVNPERLTADGWRRFRKGYNNPVSGTIPPPTTSADKHTADEHHHRHAAYAAEATGLLLMAVVLLILTIVGSWRYILWGGAR
jgi:hypothetical protein